jgi:hypothetical protein
MVPGEGLEPTSPCGRRILSPLRLPIPPPRHRIDMEKYKVIIPRRRIFATTVLAAFLVILQKNDAQKRDGAPANSGL